MRKYNLIHFLRPLMVIAILLPNAALAAQILFEDSFSGDLSQWVGRNGGAHQGQIVSDPIQPLNKVLSFTGLNYSGDIFTKSIQVGGFSQVLLDFDYLGLAQPASRSGNLGGFLGISVGLVLESGGGWLAGTELSAASGLAGVTGIEIIDDGNWHHYQMDLTLMISTNTLSHFHILIEDWADAGGVAGDAYFDNIRVSALPDAGLVARWKADGNANDVTGKHNGSLQSGLSFTAGKVGQGFDFTGKKGGYVEIPNDPSLNVTQAITLEAWIKANNWDGTPRIIQKASDNIAYMFHVQGADPPLVPNLVLYLWGVNVEGSAAPQAILAPAPSTGNWHHVVGTYDGSKITLFIDGKIVAQHNASGSISVSSDVINIGNKPHSTDPRPYFDGVIDEVAIYNRALSVGEIQATYESGNRPSFQSVRNSTFSGCRLIFGGLVGTNYSIEASSNLINWIGLTTLRVTNESMTFIDSSATNQQQKFYRAKQIP